MVQVCVQIGLMSPLHFNCRFFIPEAFGDGLIPPAAESDILRLYLLKKYGGVWVDATNLCRRPLDAWLPSAACEGFFAFFPDLQSPEHKGVPHIISSAWAGWIISVYIYTLMRPRLSIAFSLTDLTGCRGMLMFWLIHQLQPLHHSAGLIRFHCFLPWASYRFCLAWAHQVTLVQKLPRATWFGIPVGQQALQEIGWTWRWRRSESSEYLGQSAKDKLWAWQEGANAFLALCWFYSISKLSPSTHFPGKGFTSWSPRYMYSSKNSLVVSSVPKLFATNSRFLFRPRGFIPRWSAFWTDVGTNHGRTNGGGGVALLALFLWWPWQVQAAPQRLSGIDDHSFREYGYRLLIFCEGCQFEAFPVWYCLFVVMACQRALR